MGLGPSPQFSELFEKATENERRRALTFAAWVRLGAGVLFLALAVALGTLGGRRDWEIYAPMLAGYVATSLVFFFLRNRAITLRLGGVVALLDVTVTYFMQSYAMPFNPFPAGVAGFSVGIFALIVALSGLALSSPVIFLTATGATVAEALLMQQAGIEVGSIVAAAVVLGLIALVSNTAIRRVRFLAVDLSQAEVARLLELRRLTEVDASKQTIERILADTRAQNECLERLQREKESLVQLIVHDLRSPLNAIILSLEYLDQELKSRRLPEGMIEAVEDARGTSNHLAGMISQILDTAKLEEGRLGLDRASLSVPELLERARQQLAPVARNKSLQVAIEVAKGIGFRGDPRLFARVIENLLSNSIRHAPMGGRVLLTAVTDGDCVRLSVHNNGTPVDTPERERIFQKFQQGKSDTLRLSGWGLGLYFCRMVVEAHGGSIAVEDVEGWPTSFVMRMPIHSSIVFAPLAAASSSDERPAITATSSSDEAPAQREAETPASGVPTSAAAKSA